MYSGTVGSLSTMYKIYLIPLLKRWWQKLLQIRQANLVIVVSERKSHLVFVLASHPLQLSSNCKARESHFWLKFTLVHMPQRPWKESPIRHSRTKECHSLLRSHIRVMFCTFPSYYPNRLVSHLKWGNQNSCRGMVRFLVHSATIHIHMTQIRCFP